MYRSRLSIPIIFLIVSQVLIILPVTAAVPLSLSITKAMDFVPSDGKQHPAFFIVIQDSAKKPHPVPYSLNVTISTSDVNVLKIQQSVQIKAAEYYAVVYASSTVLENTQAEVTVTAPGFQSSKITINAAPPAGAPSSLKVTLLPNIVSPLTIYNVMVIVTLVDGYGNPTLAREDVDVLLTSSNLNVATLTTQNLKIPKGTLSAQNNLKSTGREGVSTITVSSPNIKSDSTTFTVKGQQPMSVYLYSPPTILTGENGVLFVGIVDAENKPVKLNNQIQVNLYSANVTRFSVPTSATINANQWYTIANLTCHAMGSTTITGITQDLTSGKVIVSGWDDTQGNFTKVKIFPLAKNFPADNLSCEAFVIQALNQAGKPMRLNSTTNIDLFSSNNDVFNIPSSVIIEDGSSYVSVSGVPSIPGVATISAIAQGVTSDQTEIISYVPTPTSFTIQTPPIPAGAEVNACIIAMDGGIPAQTQQNTLLSLTSSNTGIGQAIENPTILQKEAFVYTKIKSLESGSFTLTITGSGVPTSKPALNVLEITASTFKMAYVPPLVNYTFPMVIQLVSSKGGAFSMFNKVDVALSSSNMEVLKVANNTTINPENTEVVVTGIYRANTATTITLTSTGYKSLSSQLKPNQVKFSFEITSKSRYTIGENAVINAKFTLNDEPVKDLVVQWSGDNLSSKVSITNAEGNAENRLNVKKGANDVSASVSIGLGSMNAQKRIQGTLDAYTLEVSSNQPIIIEGSGTYQFGQTVSISAPQTISMAGILGTLGGKYIFKEWTGAVPSKNNTIDITINGNQETLIIKAFYSEDYTTVLTILGASIIVVAIAFVVVKKFMKKSKKQTFILKPGTPQKPGSTPSQGNQPKKP